MCHAHKGLTKLNINSRRKKEPRLLCVMLLKPYSDKLLFVDRPIGNDAKDKRGCQGVQIIIGKPVNGHLGAPQTRPIANLAPNQLGPYSHNLGDLYQRRYHIHVPISELLKEC